MVIVWDEVKRRANLLKHGLDLAAFEDGFDLATARGSGPTRAGRAGPASR